MQLLAEPPPPQNTINTYPRLYTSAQDAPQFRRNSNNMWPVNPNLPSQTCTQEDIAAVTPLSRLDNFVRPVRRRRKCRRSMHTWTQLFPELSPCLEITAVWRRLETAILSLEPPLQEPCSCLTFPAPSSVPLPSVYLYCLCQVLPKKMLTISSWFPCLPSLWPF